MARLQKSLVDPSPVTDQSAPDNIREFVQLANHHLVLPLDNLSSLPDWLSDAISRSCTGSGFSKRTLFTDDEDHIYHFQRITTLNGINLLLEKPDLLDRSIIIGLERLTKEERKKEEPFYRSFNKKKPQILGAIFDAISKALKNYDKINPKTSPRMADFYHWGAAIAMGLGDTKEAFWKSYDNNIRKQDDEAIQASPVGLAVTFLLEDRDSWKGTPTEFFQEIEVIAGISHDKNVTLDPKIRINPRAKAWPKDARWAIKRLNQVAANLAVKGIKVEHDRTSEHKEITIYRNNTENNVTNVTNVIPRLKRNADKQKTNVTGAKTNVIEKASDDKKGDCDDRKKGNVTKKQVQNDDMTLMTLDSDVVTDKKPPDDDDFDIEDALKLLGEKL